MRVNVLGVCETKMIGAGSIKEGSYTITGSGGDQRKNGVAIIADESATKCILGTWCISDRVMLAKIKGKHFNTNIIQVYAPTAQCDESDIENFYEDLERARAQCKSQEVVIVMGEMHAKVGEGRDENIVGDYGLGEGNERGEKFINWCKTHNQMIANT